MWQAISDFLLKAHASGLGHDAVIEIMIALLGIMVAVLTLIAGLLSVGIAVLGIFGYNALKDELKKKASADARKTAKTIALEVMEQIRERAQASGMSDSQAEELSSSIKEAKPFDTGAPKAVKATSDTGLRREQEEKP
jgi:ABC-type bacteriocin/lantibiotic exporter with double-glycine peptidase domain